MTVSASRKSERPDANKAYALVAIPPQSYDKYTLIGKLGHGGMAEVNLAVAQGKGGFRKLTVIKRLHRHLAMEPGFIDMFLDEARLAARLNHPHCVQTYEVGEVEGNHFLAMEYLDGQGLERLLRMSGQLDETMPAPLAARIVADALDGLAYAHELTDFDGTELCVVHRDVSPQNIFITYNGMVKLLDFGIAKAATHVVETKTGVIKGKYAYIAPEQALGQTVDQRSDLWSMGVVLWEVLTGRRLFKSVNELATLHETLQGEIKLPSAFRPDLPTELDTICMRALQRDPEQRYQSAQEMKDELERYIRSVPSPPGRKQIARLMKERFGGVIETHKKTLAACLKGTGQVTHSTIERLVPQNTTSSETGMKSLDGAGHTPTPTPTPAPVSHSSVTPPPNTMSRSMEAPAEERPGAWIWKAGVVAAVIAIALLLGLLLPLGDDDETTTGAVGAVATSEVPSPPDDVVLEPTEIPTETTPEAPPPNAVPDDAVDTGDTGDTGEGTAAPPDDEAGGADDAEEPAPSSRRRRLTARERARLAAARRERREREQQQAAQQSTQQPPDPPPPAGDTGFLTLVTTPWTNVTLGSRTLGMTPLMRVELPPGAHTLRLVNREAGIDQTYRIQIRAGQTTTRRVGLR